MSNEKVVNIFQKKLDAFVDQQLIILLEILSIFDAYGITDPDEVRMRLGNILTVIEGPGELLDSICEEE